VRARSAVFINAVALERELAVGARRHREPAATACHRDAGGRRWRTVPARANGQLAFESYRVGEDGASSPHGLSVVTLRGDRIEAITAFLMPELVDGLRE